MIPALTLVAGAALGCGSVVLTPGDTSTPTINTGAGGAGGATTIGGAGGAVSTTGTGGAGGSCENACPTCTAFTPWSKAFSKPGLVTMVDDWLSVAPDGTVFLPTVESKASIQQPWAGDHLFKIDPAGQVLWQIDDVHALNPVADDACGVFVVGAYGPKLTAAFGGPVTCTANDCPYLAHLDPSGKRLWLHASDGGAGFTAYPTWARGTADGRIVIAGDLQGALDFDAVHLESPDGYFASFVVALSPDGTGLWGRLIHTNAKPNVSLGPPTNLAVSPTGDVVVTGNFDAEIDFGDGPIQKPAGPGDSGTYVATFDPSGNLGFADVFDNPVSLGGWSVAMDASGDVVMSGAVKGVTDLGGGPVGEDGQWQLVVAKLDFAGNHMWSRALASSFFGTQGLAVNGAGHIFTSAAGGVMELDASGSVVATHLFGGSGDHVVNSIRLGPGGALIVAGTFDDTIDLGHGLLTAIDARSAFVGVLSP